MMVLIDLNSWNVILIPWKRKNILKTNLIMKITNVNLSKRRKINIKAQYLYFDYMRSFLLLYLPLPEQISDLFSFFLSLLTLFLILILFKNFSSIG